MAHDSCKCATHAHGFIHRLCKVPVPPGVSIFPLQDGASKNSSLHPGGTIDGFQIDSKRILMMTTTNTWRWIQEGLLKLQVSPLVPALPFISFAFFLI